MTVNTDRGAAVHLQWAEDRPVLVVEGHGTLAMVGDPPMFLADLDVVAPASWLSLRRALVRSHTRNRVDSSQREELLVVLVGDHADDERDDSTGISLIVREDKLLVRVIVDFFALDLDTETTRNVVAALLDRYRCTDLDITEHETDRLLVFSPGAGLRTVRSALRLGASVRDLLHDVDGGGRVPFRVIPNVLRSRRPEALIGQQESAVVEAKRAPYRLEDPAAAIELAQDVARFANAEDGGILLVGFKTRKVAGLDTIVSVAPAPLATISAQRYRGAVDRLVYPPVDGLIVESVDLAGSEGLLFVVVPPQREAHKPFLVHGAVVQGKVEGAFISIVRRRGEASIPITAQAIHAALARGRAIGRRGED
jgi:hypothetical protein